MSVGVTAKHSFSSPARNLVVSKNALKNLSRCQTLCQLSEAGGGKHGEFNGFFLLLLLLCVYTSMYLEKKPPIVLPRKRESSTCLRELQLSILLLYSISTSLGES